MTDRERAIEYIRIFINVGDSWQGYVPVEGELTEAGVRIGDCELGPAPGEDGTWFLNDGGTVSWFRAAS
jgi:hypothetical protein